MNNIMTLSGPHHDMLVITRPSCALVGCVWILINICFNMHYFKLSLGVRVCEDIDQYMFQHLLFSAHARMLFNLCFNMHFVKMDNSLCIF